MDHLATADPTPTRALRGREVVGWALALVASTWLVAAIGWQLGDESVVGTVAAALALVGGCALVVRSAGRRGRFAWEWGPIAMGAAALAWNHASPTGEGNPVSVWTGIVGAVLVVSALMARGSCRARRAPLVLGACLLAVSFVTTGAGFVAR